MIATTILISGLSVQTANAYYEVPAAPGRPKSKIKSVEKKPTAHSAIQLELPAELLTEVKKDNPGYRIPVAKDMSGPWSQWVDKKVGNMPFYTRGDFNGDGDKDIALFLLKDKTFRFVLYHKKGRKYELGITGDYSSGVPQDLVLSTTPKTEEFVFRYSVNMKEKEYRKRYPFDALVTANIMTGVTEVTFWSTKKNGYDIDLFGSH